MGLAASRYRRPATGRLRSPPESRFCRRTNHINGVFAADIMRFRRVFAGHARNSRETAAIALFAGCFCLNDRSTASTGKQRTAGPLFGEDVRHDRAPARRVGKANGSHEVRARWCAHHLAWCSARWWARRKCAFAHPTKFRTSRGPGGGRGCVPRLGAGQTRCAL
jgi:hypothetical protein